MTFFAQNIFYNFLTNIFQPKNIFLDFKHFLTIIKKINTEKNFSVHSTQHYYTATLTVLG